MAARLRRPEAAGHLKAYRAALREAGHAGDGNVYLRIPVYVAATAAQARSEPEESTMRAYRRRGATIAPSGRGGGGSLLGVGPGVSRRPTPGGAAGVGVG